MELGWWAMSAEQAESLVGGWAYLHETSTDKSYACYRIRGFKPGAGEWAGRWGFELEKKPSIKPVKWRGVEAGQNPSDNYRINPALPHELEQA